MEHEGQYPLVWGLTPNTLRLVLVKAAIVQTISLWFLQSPCGEQALQNEVVDNTLVTLNYVKGTVYLGGDGRS